MMPRSLAVATATLFHLAHHVHGVHEGTNIISGRASGKFIDPVVAFQIPYSKYYRNKPSASSQLDYSSDEDGIHDWVQPKLPKQTTFADDMHIETEDHFVHNRWECIDGKHEDTKIIDDWTNDASERRNRRLQSLEMFNQANAQHPSKSSEKKGEADSKRRTSRETTGEPSIDNILELPYNDLSQLQAIKSNAPAILLPSGPGTGKSHVLSLRIAYILQKHLKRKTNGYPAIGYDGLSSASDECAPDSMVILSFTNRDAERLKERALNYLFPGRDADSNTNILRNETSQQLWSGTMHAFSLAILNKYGSLPLRVSPAREMRNRVSASLKTLLDTHDGETQTSSKRELHARHLQALNDVGHSRSILCQNIVRSIDLWKEANIPSLVNSIQGETDDNECQQLEVKVRKTCMELAMRLGIPKSSALLALDVYPEYQARHARAGSADPSDLAGMAYRLLIDQPKALHLLRSKLKHIIVDEYQDQSVSQHALLRLVVRGVVNESESMMTGTMRKKRKAEQRRRRKLPVLLEPIDRKRRFKPRTHSSTVLQRSYSVPSIFCAGDASQSVYGWRGGAPELTVHGFRRDYPQGIIAPLETCYRLPNDIVEAAAMLLPMGLDEKEEVWGLEASDCTSFDVSPAAAAKVASSVRGFSTSSVNVVDSTTISRPLSSENSIRLGNQLLLSKGMQKLDSIVEIHGLWDSREEAKYIASTIRRRSKERRRALISALSNLDDGISLPSEKELPDLTDVAVLVRSSNQFLLVQDALTNAGIPFITNENKGTDPHKKEDEGSQNWLSRKRTKQVKTIPMKPALVITMHRSKGEEYDDVYLAGWTEEEFPHPDAVSSSRVHEERRLAYVALTRARQRVVITHSFMKRVLHYGKDGRKKYVTGQVQPSRFLYELMPSMRIKDGATNSNGLNNDVPLFPSRDNKGTVWNRSTGIKEYVCGQNLPRSFQKAYHMPAGYVAKRSDLRRVSNVDMGQKMNAKPRKPRQHEKISRKTSLQIIEEGMIDIVVLRKKGASKKYRPIFKEMLASFFQIRRGNALVFRSGAKSRQTQNECVRALVEASAEELVKKPLGKCTATQLGHYLAYLILKQSAAQSKSRSAPVRNEYPKHDLARDAHQSPQLNESRSHEESLKMIEGGLKDIIVLRKKGASKKYTPIFKGMLTSFFQIRRGNALVFKQGAKSKQKNECVRALVDAEADELVKRPLGKCTATQLGHYVAYLILKDYS